MIKGCITFSETLNDEKEEERILPWIKDEDDKNWILQLHLSVAPF